jgi:SAM-dependent methyltransferase
MLKKLRLWHIGAGLTSVWLATAALQFPTDTDGPIDRVHEQMAFYSTAYDAPKSPSDAERAREQKYVDIATRAAEAADIEGIVERFVHDFSLHKKKVLDVGSGRGYLQDAVENYTGLDISATAARFYHKRFVLGSATAMPFEDSTFDAIWSIWVVEHIPNPEAALSEIRRVIKPGGVLLLAPAWSCDPWAAEGYAIRPYSDFAITGRLTKASLLVRNSVPFRVGSLLSTRLIRLPFLYITGPTKLHYRRIVPNYNEYWVPDSDAVNSLDAMETAAWFQSRGDECLTCPPGWKRMFQPEEPLIIRIRKRQ